jgi:hypothetical protein
VSLPLSRELEVATRRFVDQNTERIEEQPTSRAVATVKTVEAGAASDGNALVTVTWRGSDVIANGYASSYTPAVGHRVVCDYIDNQLTIAYRVVGTPTRG